MLPRPTYRKALKVLDKIKKQHDADRQENPHRIPMDWKSTLSHALDHLLTEDRVAGRRDHLIKTTLEAWVKEGKLIPYYGGLTFAGTEIPSMDAIKASVDNMINQIDQR